MVIRDSSDSAPAANAFIPHDAPSDATDGRTAITGRGQDNTDSVTVDVNTVITRAQQKHADHTADTKDSDDELNTWQQMCDIDLGDVEGRES